MDADVVNASNTLAQTILNAYGPWGTLGIVLAIGGYLFVSKYLSDSRADKQINLALMEKERTIQRLAHSERLLRKLLFQKLGFDINEDGNISAISAISADAKDGAEGKKQ